MSEEKHPVDDLLRALAGSPEVDAGDLAYIQSRLDAAIQDEKRAHRIQNRRRRVMVWAAAATALVVGASLVLQTTRVSPAEATLEAIAEVVETVDPLTVSDSEFVYTRSEVQARSIVPREALDDLAYEGDELVYLLSSTRETWFGSDGSVQIRTTVHDASFLAPEDEAVYYAAGLDQQDDIGKTDTLTVTDPAQDDWPTDPHQLDQTIRARMTQGQVLPETVEYLTTALNIIREAYISPELRAAILRLIADLDGLEHPADSADEPAEFYIEYPDQGVMIRFTFRIDSQGYLRFEERVNLEVDTNLGVPADTPVFRAEYTRPTVTANLQAP